VRFVCEKEIEKREKERRQSKCPSKIKKKQKHFWSFSFLRQKWKRWKAQPLRRMNNYLKCCTLKPPSHKRFRSVTPSQQFSGINVGNKFYFRSYQVDTLLNIKEQIINQEIFETEGEKTVFLTN
jgi:hypothetical protein